MASTADEEARRLDEKIAEIRRKNELILRRRKEIEDDKKLAEQQNAVVQLKPSTEDWPRERTPAMKPSKRDMAAANYSYQDTPPSRDSVRRDRPGTTSGSRGSELMEKGAGPPPDPRSFLSDPDRESSFGNSRDRPQTNRRDLGQEFRGKGAPQRENYDERGRGGGRRGGGREGVGGGERERGGGGGGGNRERRNRIDENWREERHQIDEARIQRQKGPDGGWRREWDNEKMTFDVEGDDNKHPALTPTKTAPPKTGGLSSRLNRWRETDNKETESEQNTLKRESVKKSAFIPVSTPKSPSERVRNPSSDKSNVTEKFEQLSPFACLERKILNESENFRITINNSRPVGTEEKPGRSTKLRQPNKRSGILRTSQSSASDEDVASPSGAKFTQYENITFTIRNEPVNIRRSDLEKMSEEDFVKLSQLAKPPLPPFRPPLQTPTQQIKTAEQDDDSWEDVTTSGTESLYESGPESPATAPLKVVTNQSQTSRPEDFICLVPPPNQSNTGQFIIYGSTNSSPRQPIIFEHPNNPSFYVIPNQANSIPVISSSIYPTTTDNHILPTATNSYFYTSTLPPPPLPPPPVSSIILEPAPQASPEQIINNSILFLPPPTVAPDTSTTSQPLAGIHHQQPNEYRQPNQSVDVDNFIMLVKPDTSIQQTEISECTK